MLIANDLDTRQELEKCNISTGTVKKKTWNIIVLIPLSFVPLFLKSKERESPTVLIPLPPRGAYTSCRFSKFDEKVEKKNSNVF